MMRVISELPLRQYAIAHRDVAAEIHFLTQQIRQATWGQPVDVQQSGLSVRFIGNERWVFNLLHNRYRLIVQIVFSPPPYQSQVFVRFIGTHAEYDRIPDTSTV
jgi:mRNA interferase HigB